MFRGKSQRGQNFTAVKMAFTRMLRTPLVKVSMAALARSFCLSAFITARSFLPRMRSSKSAVSRVRPIFETAKM